MTHPYRELYRDGSPADRGRPSAQARLRWGTFVFGLGGALVAQSLGGPRCTLLATMLGVALLLRPPPR